MAFPRNDEGSLSNRIRKCRENFLGLKTLQGSDRSQDESQSRGVSAGAFPQIFSLSSPDSERLLHSTL